MKIAFLNIYNGVIDRGAETFVKELATRLSKNHDVYVAQSGKLRGNEKYRVIEAPVNWNWGNKSGVGSLRAKFYLDYWSREVAYFTLKLLPRLFKEKFDIVIPVNGGWQPAFVRLITGLYGGKMIISGQSGIGWDDLNNLWSFPDYFVALSSYARDWAKTHNPFVKIKYIPNGVDQNKFSKDGKELKVNLKKPIILCVGALIPSKRVDLTIKAVAKLRDVSLLVVGDGDLKKQIQNLGEKLLGTRFKLLKLPFEKMPEVYRSANLFTIASEKYYSFEIVLVEAMASGVPVVANKDEIREEIVGNAGILVDPRDLRAYSVALEIALKNKWGKKPMKQAMKFNWDKIGESYEKVFKEITK